jgi:type IV/VI secretion system ImpK/VasF family protein
VAKLFDCFAPVFSLGLELDARIAASTAPAQVEPVYAQLRAAVDRAKAAALAAGYRPEQADSAVFSVVAWLDEIVARNPAYWASGTPLQVAIFNTNNAGNEFFQQFGALKASDDEVREVYYHALLCGFVGQYYFETGENGELGKLKELHARQLPIAPAPTHTLREERITPQPYLTRDPSGPRYPRQWDNLVLKVGVALALAIPLIYLLYLLLAAPKDSGPTLAQQVDQRLQGYPCSDLSATVADDGVTAVSGTVSKPEEIEQVRSDVSAIKGVKDSSFDLSVRIWPHCEVVAILKPYRERNLDRRQGLEVRPTTGHSDRFIEGERVMVKLQQANFDGYLYVDYYTVDGTVLHLYPNRREPESGRLVVSAEQFLVGEKAPWEIGPPFGQELITVIASPVPLYTSERPEIEQASVYVPRLREMLDANQAADRLSADFLFMQTEPKK